MEDVWLDKWPPKPSTLTDVVYAPKVAYDRQSQSDHGPVYGRFRRRLVGVLRTAAPL
jgi:hypothetical protein